jgi:hypothetical protein
MLLFYSAFVALSYGQLAVIPFPAYLPSSIPMPCRGTLSKTLRCSLTLDQPLKSLAAEELAKICSLGCASDIRDLYKAAEARCSKNYTISISSAKKVVQKVVDPLRMISDLEFRYSSFCSKLLLRIANPNAYRVLK